MKLFYLIYFIFYVQPSKNQKILLFHSGSIPSRRMLINAARCLAFPVAADSRFFPRAKQQAKAKPDTQTFQDCSTQTEITSVDQNAGCRCTSSLRFREHRTWPSTWALCFQEVHVFVIICEPVSCCLVICGWRTCRHVH